MGAAPCVLIDRVGLQGEPTAWLSSGWSGKRLPSIAGHPKGCPHLSVPVMLRLPLCARDPEPREARRAGLCGLKHCPSYLPTFHRRPLWRWRGGSLCSRPDLTLAPAMLSSQPLSLSLLSCPPLPQSGNLACPQVPLFMSLPFLGPFHVRSVFGDEVADPESRTQGEDTRDPCPGLCGMLPASRSPILVSSLCVMCPAHCDPAASPRARLA